MARGDKGDETPESVPAPVDTEVAAATASPPEMPANTNEPADPDEKEAAASSGSIDIAMSLTRLPQVDADGAPVEVPADDSGPVSSGRVTSMHAAATGPTESGRSRSRITDVGKDMLGKGVSTLGSGIETIGAAASKLGEVSHKVPVVGSGMSRLGEGISSVGESIAELPRVARTRRGALLVRSLFVGMLLVAAWIVVIVLLQVRGTDSPDFRPQAERILRQISQGKVAIEKLYDEASPRFQEVVRKERFVDDMLDLDDTCGAFLEITSITQSFVTTGPTGRIGRMSMFADYAKGPTRAAVSLHWSDGKWKLLGVSVEVPPSVTITNKDRENRVSACIRDASGQKIPLGPMDAKRCDLHVAADHILSQLRDGHAGDVWDEATDVFQQQEAKARFSQIQAEHQRVLGEYRRILTVTEAKVINKTRATFDVLVEYSRANVRANFGFLRASKADPWELRSLKVALPMPRSDDPAPDGDTSEPPTPVDPGSGSAAPVPGR